MSKASPTTPRNIQPRRAWKAWLPALTAALILILVALDSEAAPKNIIVMIGDGMGPAHIVGYRHMQHSQGGGERDRKSTRLNSSHVAISYAVFCLKKKTH